jgi:hypothetical protein
MLIFCRTEADEMFEVLMKSELKNDLTQRFTVLPCKELSALLSSGNGKTSSNNNVRCTISLKIGAATLPP